MFVQIGAHAPCRVHAAYAHITSVVVLMPSCASVCGLHSLFERKVVCVCVGFFLDYHGVILSIIISLSQPTAMSISRVTPTTQYLSWINEHLLLE